MKLGYMNSRRPSKPNLPSAPKPSKLLAPIRLRQTLSSLAYWIPQSPIASTKMNWSLLNCFPSTKIPPHWYEYGKIRIWVNVPLKDMLMERVRVEEFGESKDEDCGWLNLVFFLDFSLKILSRNSLKYMGIRGIYIGVCLECEKSVFFQTKWTGDLASWLDWVASLSRELTAWPDRKFYLVVL